MPTPTPTTTPSYPSIAGVHDGTFYYSSMDYVNLSLDIQQDGSQLSGSCDINNGGSGSGDITGSMRYDGQFSFTCYDSSNNVTTDFGGTIYNDGTLRGAWSSSCGCQGTWATY